LATPEDTNDSALLFLFHNRGVVAIIDGKSLPSWSPVVHLVSVIANLLSNLHATLDHWRTDGSPTVAHHRRTS
jgi:hypothetical protein